MKKIMMAVAVLGLSATGAMAADGASQDISLSANVAKFCSGGSATGLTGTVTDLVSNGQITSDSTLTLSGTASDAVCNAATVVSLTSAKGGLKGTATAPAGSNFVDRIDYTASITFGGQTVSLSTATNGTTAVTAETSGPASGSLAVAVTAKATASGKTLVADPNYTDTLTVKVVPKS